LLERACRSRARFLLLLLIPVVLPQVPVHTGTIVGRVSDDSLGPLPGVEVS
jgi:hypothetical protein